MKRNAQHTVLCSARNGGATYFIKGSREHLGVAETRQARNCVRGRGTSLGALPTAASARPRAVGLATLIRLVRGCAQPQCLGAGKSELSNALGKEGIVRGRGAHCIRWALRRYRG